MKNSFIYLIVLLCLIPDFASSAPIVGCPGTINHVEIEESYYKTQKAPYPDLIIPDVGAYSGTRIEWNYLNKRRGLPPVTAHCFYGKGDSSKKVDVPLPFNIKRCIFDEKGKFYCTEKARPAISKHTAQH